MPLPVLAGGVILMKDEHLLWQGHGPVQPGLDHLKVLDELLIGQTCLVRIELPAIRALEAACGGLNSRVPARVSSTVI